MAVISVPDKLIDIKRKTIKNKIIKKRYNMINDLKFSRSSPISGRIYLTVQHIFYFS